jgi:hypothetical protein
MARPRIPDEDRSMPVMISLPKRHQEALKRMARESAARGGPMTVSGLIREMVEAHMDSTNPPQALVPLSPDLTSQPADLVPEPDAWAPAQTVADQMRQLLAASPPKPPSQMTREEREERMRQMDPEGYRKMREAYEEEVRLAPR